MFKKLAILLLMASPAAAQSVTFGYPNGSSGSAYNSYMFVNTFGSSPYAFGANINAVWTQFGTIGTNGITWVEPQAVVGGSTTFIDLHTMPPATGTFTAQSSLFSYYPTVGNDPGDHQLAQEYLAWTPVQDATISETGISINSYVNSGLATAWPGATTAVSSGKLIDANGYIWKATTAGTTGGSQPSWPGSPTLGVTTQTDGSVVWTVQTHDQSNAKMATFITTTAGPNAGKVWSLVTDTVLNSGWNGGFSAGVEFDYSNNSGADCLTCQTVFVSGAPGPNKIGAGISLWNGSATNTAFKDAIIMGGTKLSSEADIKSFAGSPVFLLDAGTTRTWGAQFVGGYSIGAIQTFAKIRLNYDFDDLEFYPSQAGNLNAWRIHSAINGASTNGNLFIQNSTDQFGVNFTTFTFSTAGNLDATSFSAGGTAGVTCSGTPTASFASKNGVVTHC